MVMQEKNEKIRGIFFSKYRLLFHLFWYFCPCVKKMINGKLSYYVSNSYLIFRLCFMRLEFLILSTNIY